MKALYSGAFILYIFMAGRWDWVSFYLRYIFAGLFAVALYISYRRVSSLPFFVQDGRSWRLKYGWSLVELLIFFGFLAFTIRGYFYSDQPLQLAFPLQGGWYYVGQGGNSSLLNYHNVSETQQYALDVLELNGAGLRARGIYPDELEQYAIFGETIYSPCDGTVTEVVDGLADNVPPATDRDHPAGNHVVIACRDAEVVLAHMQQDSLMVREGEMAATGQPLGQVGNSGNTSEPHLHIHAVRRNGVGGSEGEGIPILFEGSFPVRNRVFAR